MRTGDKRLARNRRWFEYHCYEGEDSSDAELWHHTHQQVEVIRKLTKQEAEMPMYLVRFADGLDYSVFNDELTKTPSAFYRPDYITKESMKVVYVSPPEDYIYRLTAPTKEDIERDRCAKCHWRNPETCKACAQSRKEVKH